MYKPKELIGGTLKMCFYSYSLSGNWEWVLNDAECTMGSVTLRYFCYGCLFTSVTWTLLLFVYFNFSEENQSFKNVPIKGLEPQKPFPKKFYPRFTRGPVNIPELQQKESKFRNPLGNHVQDPVKGQGDFSPEMGECSWNGWQQSRSRKWKLSVYLFKGFQGETVQ